MSAVEYLVWTVWLLVGFCAGALFAFFQTLRSPGWVVRFLKETILRDTERLDIIRRALEEP